MSLKTIDRETNTTIRKKDLVITKGAINLEKLIGLKLYNMRKQLAEGMDKKDTLINLELTSGNYDQGFTQLFVVEIFVRP